MISLQGIARNDEQRARAAELQQMHARGEFLAWNWPATFLMGFWALGNKLWRAFFRLIWTNRTTYIVLALSIVLLFVAPKLSLPLIIGYVAYIAGKYGNDLKYIMHGDRAAAGFRREDLLVYVGLYLFTWALLALPMILRGELTLILGWFALMVCGLQLLRSQTSCLLPTCGVMVLLPILGVASSVAEFLMGARYIMGASPTAEIRRSLLGVVIQEIAGSDVLYYVTAWASPLGVTAVLLYYYKTDRNIASPQDAGLAEGVGRSDNPESESHGPML